MNSKLWEVMNDLEVVTSKICSAREIIDAAIDRIQEHEYDKAEMMMSAAYEFLEYYLGEFDEKFKLAWQETVVKQKQEENDAWDVVNKEREYYKGKASLSCDKNDPSPECRGAWNSFWEDMYYPEESKNFDMKPWEHTDLEEISKHYSEDELNAMCDAAKKKKWTLPVQQSVIDGVDDYYVNFPDDLLEAADLKEGDEVEWVDNSNGTYTLKKVIKPLEMDEC